MKHKTFNTITGLTQEEMAMWLSIPRSQWSMYESGKRNLPQKSSASFAMLLEELKKSEKRNDEIKVIQLREEKAMFTNFVDEIKNIELDVLRLQVKISAMEAKRNKCFAALKVAIFIENNPKNDAPKDLASAIKDRCRKTLEKYPLYRLESMKLKIEILNMLKEKTKQKLKTP